MAPASTYLLVLISRVSVIMSALKTISVMWWLAFQINSDQRRLGNENNLPGLKNALSVNVGLQIKRMCNNNVCNFPFFRFLLIEETKLVASVVIYVQKKNRIVDCSISVVKSFLFCL